MEVIGTIKEIRHTEKVSDKFKKREFVLTTEAKSPYPQHVSFQVTQDKCESLDRFKIGDEVKIQFNLRGREWNGPKGVKYFNTLECWRIELAHLDANHAYAEAAVSPAYQESNDNDDLPF